MAVVDNGDIIVVIGTVIVVNSVCENAYAFKILTGSGGLSSSQAGTQVRGMFNAMYGIIRPDIWSGCVFDNLSVKNWTKSADVGSFAWDTTGWVAGNVNDPLPQGVCALITFPTSVLKARGRKFLPGYTEAANQSNAEWSSGVQTRMANMGALMLTLQAGYVTGASGQYGVLHGGTLGTTFVTPTSAVARAVPAYQRRRKP